MPTPARDPFLGLAPSGANRAAATRAVKDLVRKHFDLDAEARVFVAEVSCGEADCPDTETVVALFLGSQRQEFRIARSLHAVTGADIVAAAEARK